MQTPLPYVPPLPRGVTYRGSSIPGFNAWKNPIRKTQLLASRLLAQEYYL